MENVYTVVSDFTPEGEELFNAYVAANLPFVGVPPSMPLRAFALSCIEDALNDGRLGLWKPKGKPPFDATANGLVIEARNLPSEFLESFEELTGGLPIPDDEE